MGYINRRDLYQGSKPELHERTRLRLEEISKLGLEEIGVAEFGIPNVMSGLYIERIWSYNDDQWADYISWIKNDLLPK